MILKPILVSTYECDVDVFSALTMRKDSAEGDIKAQPYGISD